MPTPAQKAAVWLVITMDRGRFEALTAATPSAAIIAQFGLDAATVDFVKQKLSAADPNYLTAIKQVADGFKNQLAGNDWGGDICPNPSITQKMHDISVSIVQKKDRKSPARKPPAEGSYET